ncbi:hyaluronidase-1-like [Thalassophryne amazonica]|uniref:hyaluronidase-1-like n=1 Tax=Thalassophryne amazonica TaxID=390379 RepID=UPI0014716E8A|nr:hyaluronidase-1-like [Thalassophryne amazonica]
MARTDPRWAPEPELKLKACKVRTQTSLRTFSLSSLHIQPLLCLPVRLVLLAAFVEMVVCGPPQPASPPLLSGQPFIIFWGIRDSSCSRRPDLRSFGMEREGRVAAFYEDTLGKYPYFLDQDTPVNRGLPQHTRLDDHLQKTQQDIEAALPAPRYLGLGVLFWAEWAPQWARTGPKQEIYLEASRALLKTFFPNWTPEEVEKWSQVDFEAAAQSVMMETLQEVKRLRPKALWGVSPYPRCNNGNPGQTLLANYTGRCPTVEMALNDELVWLWKRCSALYPLLTLEKLQGGTSGTRLYLSNQIREALRVASVPGVAYDLPVFPLVKSVYTSTNTFISQTDLVNTIGESAAMGTAGVVIWERSETRTERECQDLAEFVRTVLGPYSINVTKAARLCSASLCQGKGRCIRQNPESSTYLHIPPQSPVLSKAQTDATETETKPPEPDTAEIWKRDFQCQWFQMLDGDVLVQQSPKDGVSAGEKLGENSSNTRKTTITSTTGLTSNGASVKEFILSSTPRTRSPKDAPDVPMGGSTKSPSVSHLTAAVCLLAGILYLQP